MDWRAEAIFALRRIKRVHLGHLPTPVESLDRLSTLLREYRVWVKRDDCSGLATGGNKTRKLEFLMADALAQRAELVLNSGAIQSNHARQVAAASARLGLQCVLVLFDVGPGRAEVYRIVGNVLLDRLFGAEIRFLPESANVALLLDTISSELIAQGKKTYLIPLGGSNGLGALAYATAFLEALEQFRTLQEPLDAIVVPSGSGGTLAGLLLGAILSGWPGKIIGISVSDRNERAIRKVRRPQLEGAMLLGIPIQAVTQTAILMDDRFVGPDYGIPTLECVRAIKLVASMEGLLLDPVYTGKAMAGLLALVEEKYFDKNVKNLLFWHTGGAVALHGYPEVLDWPQA
jgi:D-cysteine desulfhydrase family pyridoxal phosphate-dependent enzyme